MHCVHCGVPLSEKAGFCTNCGNAISDSAPKKEEVFWRRRKAIGWMIATFIGTSFFCSLFWFALMVVNYVDPESYYHDSAYVAAHLFETYGRYEQIWDQNKAFLDDISTAISDDCRLDPTCANDAMSVLTAKATSIQKQKDEIDNLWSEENVWLRFKSFYMRLDGEDQQKFGDVFKIYFPEKSGVLQTGIQQL